MRGNDGSRCLPVLSYGSGKAIVNSVCDKNDKYAERFQYLSCNCFLNKTTS